MGTALISDGKVRDEQRLAQVAMLPGVEGAGVEVVLPIVVGLRQLLRKATGETGYTDAVERRVRESAELPCHQCVSATKNKFQPVGGRERKISNECDEQVKEKR